MVSEKPVKEFKAGSVRASVWENHREKNGQKFNVQSVRIERRFRDQEGNWKSSNSFGTRELPLLQVVVAKAFEHLVLNEREPNGKNGEE